MTTPEDTRVAKLEAELAVMTKERDCYRALHGFVPFHVRQAVGLGDVAACEAEARRVYEFNTGLIADRLKAEAERNAALKVAAEARAKAFASVALEIRASIACAKRDGDGLDEDFAEAVAEQCESYADGDGQPDDERNRALLRAVACPVCNGRSHILAGNSVWPCACRESLATTPPERKP